MRENEWKICGNRTSEHMQSGVRLLVLQALIWRGKFTHKICELSVSESCTKRLHMQSLTVFGGVNSRYTFVRRLGNSRLSEALISEK